MAMPRTTWPLRLMLGAVLGLLLALTLAVAPASAHALPIAMSPAPRQVLRVPPSEVKITFSEPVNPAVAKIHVTDTRNVSMDYGDTEVSGSDQRVVTDALQLLKPGSYIVVWSMQSAADGHVSKGSYYFQIANANGTVPPPPSLSSTQDVNAAAQLDGPTWLQTVANFIALIMLTLWAGGHLWETWVLNPAIEGDPDLRAAAEAAARRFRRFADSMLAILLLANVVTVLAQAASLSGDWSGAFSAPILRALLFGSRFGQLWWARQLTALVALYLPALAERLRLGRLTKAPDAPALDTPQPQTVPDWRAELVATLRQSRSLPRRLRAGVLARSWLERILLLCALALLTLQAFSGHAAAVGSDRVAYSVSVDLLHLLAEACWLGGLFYIATMFLPATRELSPRSRAMVLAQGLPRFGALAILAATLLAATGSLSTTIRLTSADQLFGTVYGRTLIIKIELFLVMAGISAYHAFRLRPRLAGVLNASAHPTKAEVGDEPERKDVAASEARALSGRMSNWLQREAMLGVGVLACVSLLGAFAGTLAAPIKTPPPPPAPVDFVDVQPAGPYSVKMTVSPATFGTNTVTVVVTDSGTQAPVVGAAVLVTTSMVEMDMGSESVQLAAVAGTPGAFTGSVDLLMGGHWVLFTKVLPPGGKDFVTTQFTVPVSS